MCQSNNWRMGLKKEILGFYSYWIYFIDFSSFPRAKVCCNNFIDRKRAQLSTENKGFFFSWVNYTVQFFT